MRFLFNFKFLLQSAKTFNSHEYIYWPGVRMHGIFSNETCILNSDLFLNRTLLMTNYIMPIL